MKLLNIIKKEIHYEIPDERGSGHKNVQQRIHN